MTSFKKLCITGSLRPLCEDVSQPQYTSSSGTITHSKTNMSRRLVKFVFLFLTTFLLVLIYLFITIEDHTSLNILNCDFPNEMVPELRLLNDLSKSLGLNLYVFDEKMLMVTDNNVIFPNGEGCTKRNFTLAIEHRFLKESQIENLLKHISQTGFAVDVFYTRKLRVKMTETDLPVAFILRKQFIYILHVMYSREDNSWWFGNLANDEQCSLKMKKLSLGISCSEIELPEFIISKFHFTQKITLKDDLSHILIPNDVQKFLNDIHNSKFIECNMTRALLFKMQYGEEKNPQSVRFKHKAWKILSKIKVILDLMNIPFWLSSGTCLGFFRQCDIITYSKDVDIGIFANDYNESIISEIEAHGIKLIHMFGFPNDSFELSFIDQGGVKLDIFFFYKEESHIWNGGTQLKTGKKYKYIFPLFDLCWTLFFGLKVRVPCQTEAYIIANYGVNWFTPVKEWDWKKSPSNVYPNGFWAEISHSN